MEGHWDKQVYPVGQDKQDFELGMVGLKVALDKLLLRMAGSDRNLTLCVPSDNYFRTIDTICAHLPGGGRGVLLGVTTKAFTGLWFCRFEA